mgnify:CR=1 FL=1
MQWIFCIDRVNNNSYGALTFEISNEYYKYENLLNIYKTTFSDKIKSGTYCALWEPRTRSFLPLESELKINQDGIFLKTDTHEYELESIVLVLSQSVSNPTSLASFIKIITDANKKWLYNEPNKNVDITLRNYRSKGAENNDGSGGASFFEEVTEEKPKVIAAPPIFSAPVSEEKKSIAPPPIIFSQPTEPVLTPQPVKKKPMLNVSFF